MAGLDIAGMLSGGLSQSAGPSGADARGGAVTIGASSPIYRAPMLDLGNPMHIAAAAGLLLLGLWAWKRAKK